MHEMLLHDFTKAKWSSFSDVINGCCNYNDSVNLRELTEATFEIFLPFLLCSLDTVTELNYFT